MQFYDPDELVKEVKIALELQGLEPEVVSAKDAVVAAGMLLRALGITPAMDAVKGLARSMDKPWADNDD